MISYKVVVIYCLLVACLSSVFAQRCNGGAQCIILQQCSGLYTRLQDGNTPELTRLLRSLHCGFQDEDPKICCPPEFRGIQNQGSSRVPTPTQATRVGAPSALLPDLTKCGIQFRDRIVGGTQADLDEHPWMALIRYDKPNGWGFYCGGVMISHRYILTAAHCVKGQGLPPTWRLSQVRLGEYNIKTAQDCTSEYCSDAPVDVEVEETVVHESYDAEDNNQQNDIALLRLSRDVPYSDYIQPICLPTTSALKNNNYDGYRAEVAGWGKTETRSESDVKLKVQVPVVSNTECSNVFGNVGRRISNKQLCAGGEPGKDSCRGDSGGSLMVQTPNENWVAIGVVSYGPSPCGTPGWPGVYTRVGAYIDWITSHMRP